MEVNKYGNYYTWAQATAGSGTTTPGEDAQYDICPKGWRLPSAGSDYTTSEQYNMIRHYINSGTFNTSEPGYENWSGVTTTDFTDAPLSLVFAGEWVSGAYADRGRIGRWWSSTSNGSSDVFSLDVDMYGYVSPRDYNGSSWGKPVRCLVSGA